MEIVLKENCLPVFDLYNAQKWRNSRYWNEPCDVILKFYKNILNDIFFRYSKKKVPNFHSYYTIKI